MGKHQINLLSHSCQIECLLWLRDSAWAWSSLPAVLSRQWLECMKVNGQWKWQKSWHAHNLPVGGKGSSWLSKRHTASPLGACPAYPAPPTLHILCVSSRRRLCPVEMLVPSLLQRMTWIVLFNSMTSPYTKCWTSPLYQESCPLQKYWASCLPCELLKEVCGEGVLEAAWSLQET